VTRWTDSVPPKRPSHAIFFFPFTYCELYQDAMQTDSSPWDLEEAILLSEIDLEIGLRERLAATLESRIKWASLLQEALNHGVC